MLHFRIYTSDVLAQMFVVTSRRALFKASLRVSVQGERGWGERYFRTLLHPTSAPDRWLEGYVNAYKVRHLPLALHIKTMWTFNYTNQINIRLHPSAPRVNGNRSRISLQAFTVSRFVHTYIADIIQRKLGTSGITRYQRALKHNTTTLACIHFYPLTDTLIILACAETAGQDMSTLWIQR